MGNPKYLTNKMSYFNNKKEKLKNGEGNIAKLNCLRVKMINCNLTIRELINY